MSEKEEKEKNKSLDEALNFDDLGTRKKTKKIKKPKKKSVDHITGYQMNEEGEVVRAGIIIGVPIDDKWDSTGYINKDIMELTGKEFVRWARGVYPEPMDEYVKLFNNAKKRLKMFWKIVHFHKFSMFQMDKNNVDSKTKH